MHQHHRVANSVALFQVAIALGAVAALTRVRLVWYGSMAVGVCGAALFLTTVLCRSLNLSEIARPANSPASKLKAPARDAPPGR
jgi:hypothetical protein